MTKTTLLLSVGAALVLAVPVAFWLKMDGDARAAQPEQSEGERTFGRALELLSEPARAVPASALDLRRAATLVDQLADRYACRSVDAACAVANARIKLLDAGVDQPGIPVLEAVNLAHLQGKGSLPVLEMLVAAYVADRKAGRGHDAIAASLRN